MNTPTEQQLSEALRDLVAAQPFEPDLAAIERRSDHLRKQDRIIRGIGITGVAVVVAAVAVSASVAIRSNTTVDRAIKAPHTTVAPLRTTQPPAPGAELSSLAASISTAPVRQPGDATLVLRDQNYPSGEKVDVYDLYADNGKYYFAQQRSGLPAQVSADHDQAGGLFHREIAAAVYAATGDLKVASQQMADAPLSPGHKATTYPANLVDNYIWENSADAIVAGSGNPQVRAGVLRLLSTLPDITVAHGTTAGQPTLTLTAGAAEVGAGYQETWIINADTGVPIKFLGGDTSKPSVTVNYGVTRVSLADVKAGRF